MKTLFLECNMGARDTMLLSALYDACEYKSDFIEIMNEAFAPFSITVSADSVCKCGISGTSIRFQIPSLTTVSVPKEERTVSVKNETEEHLNYLLAHAMQQHESENAASAEVSEDNSSDYPTNIHELALPAPVKDDISAIYAILNHAHATLGQPALTPLPLKDKQSAMLLANIAGCALLFYMMAPEQIICSPIHVGNGFVQANHSIVSVPAPATAALLKDIPCYTSGITGSLLDSANAAILKYFTTQFGVMPALSIRSIGYGIGANDFIIANYTRVFMGNTAFSEVPAIQVKDSDVASLEDAEKFSNTDKIISITCNVDDMTGEALSLATEILLAAGAIDVYTTSIQMKKNRPGVLLTCLCKESDLEKFIGLFFLHTSSQEVRYQTFTRAKLESTIVSKHSSYDNIRVKKSSGYGVEKEKPDFEDLKSIVLKNGVTIADIEFDE